MTGNVAAKLATVWFKPDLEITADARFALALLPSMAAGEPLAMPESLQLQAASIPLQHFFASRFPNRFRCVPLIATAPAVHSGGNGVGLLFTGGIDSWHSLLEYQDEITHLVYVMGYDIPLAETAFQQRVENMLAEVASSFGKTLIVLNTNLRQHIRSPLISWRYYHMSALVAAVMLLRPTIGRLYVSGSYPNGSNVSTGTYEDVDPLWSTEYLDVRHVGSMSRLEKTRRVASSPLAMRTLRVCWKNWRSDRLNCGRCEKCLRTMAALQKLGVLKHCTTLPDRERLIRRPRLRLGHRNANVFWDELDSDIL